MNESKTLKVRLLKSGFPNKTVFVLGSTGSGKTTLIANLICETPRFVLFDTRNEYATEFFGEDTIAISSIAELVDALNNQKYKVVYKLPSGNEADAAFDSALYLIYQFQAANRENEDLPPVTIILDELNRFAETSSWPESLQEIVQRGRDYKIQKIFGAQWFGTIPTWCRDSFSEIYCFRHSDKNGLNLLERFGFEPEQIKNLPLYHCLHNGKNGVESVSLVPDSTSVDN